jgi:hypothetical protein
MKRDFRLCRTNRRSEANGLAAFGGLMFLSLRRAAGYFGRFAAIRMDSATARLQRSCFPHPVSPLWHFISISWRWHDGQRKNRIVEDQYEILEAQDYR